MSRKRQEHPPQQWPPIHFGSPSVPSQRRWAACAGGRCHAKAAVRPIELCSSWVTAFGADRACDLGGHQHQLQVAYWSAAVGHHSCETLNCARVCARTPELSRARKDGVRLTKIQSRKSYSYGKGWKAHFCSPGRELRPGKVTWAHHVANAANGKLLTRPPRRPVACGAERGQLRWPPPAPATMSPSDIDPNSGFHLPRLRQQFVFVGTTDHAPLRLTKGARTSAPPSVSPPRIGCHGIPR